MFRYGRAAHRQTIAGCDPGWAADRGRLPAGHFRAYAVPRSISGKALSLFENLSTSQREVCSYQQQIAALYWGNKQIAGYATGGRCGRGMSFVTHISTGRTRSGRHQGRAARSAATLPFQIVVGGMHPRVRYSKNGDFAIGIQAQLAGSRAE